MDGCRVSDSNRGYPDTLYPLWTVVIIDFSGDPDQLDWTLLGSTVGRVGIHAIALRLMPLTADSRHFVWSDCHGD